MAVGQTYAVTSGTGQQYFVPSGFDVQSMAVLNPNDGVCYMSRNRAPTPPTTVGAWDYKIPSQSYALLPGPYLSAGIWYVDQSGSSRAGEITLYPIQAKTVVPVFQAIGRAVQVAGSILDITQGNQPANPPLSTTRLWVDGSGHLHLLNGTGTDTPVVDSANVASYTQPLINATGLGGDLSGTIPNGRVTAHTGPIYADFGIPLEWNDANHKISVNGSNQMLFDEYGAFYWRASNRSLATTMTLDNTGNLTIAGTVLLIQGSPADLQYGGGSNHIQFWTNGNFYWDCNGGGWNWRDSSRSLASAMTLSNTGSLSVYNGLAMNNTPIGGVSQLTLNPGWYIIPSGNDMYYRSGGSGYHYFQSTGGSPGTIVTGNGSFNNTVDVVQWIRCQNGTIYLTTLGGSVGIQVDNAGNGNWNAYVPNGSGNFRIQHADGSWSGSQAANFQVQSDIRQKFAVTEVPDTDCLTRLRTAGIPVITWQPGNTMPLSPSVLDIGFAAQDMEAATPEAVTVDNDGNYFLAYANLTAVLWGALRELDRRVSALSTSSPLPA